VTVLLSSVCRGRLSGIDSITDTREAALYSASVVINPLRINSVTSHSLSFPRSAVCLMAVCIYPSHPPPFFSEKPTFEMLLTTLDPVRHLVSLSTGIYSLRRASLSHCPRLFPHLGNEILYSWQFWSFRRDRNALLPLVSAPHSRIGS